MLKAMASDLAVWALLGAAAWAALRLEPGTFLPPLSWPIITSCIWLALLHVRPRLQDKRQHAFAGVLASAMMMLFLLQDGEFSSWGDVYFFCGSRMQYCTCGYRWNLAGWNKACVLTGFVLMSALGLQRLLVQVVLQGLLPGEESVTVRDSFISIGWRLLPYVLNQWEQSWGAECSSMLFELPQFAVELIVILPCVQVICSRMKVLAMTSVNAALPRGLEGVTAQQVEQSFVPNVQRGCWERRPEQRRLADRLRANRHVTAFVSLLCVLAFANALYMPLHLEGAVLAHLRASAMQAAGRMPQPWETVLELGVMSNQLQRGALNLTHSFVTQQTLKHIMHSRRARWWVSGHRLSLSELSLSEQPTDDLVQEVEGQVLAGSAASPNSGSLAAWVAAVEQGPWRHNATWAAAAVGELRLAFNGYRKECNDVRRFQSTAVKHHYELFRMQDPSHRLSIPLIEAALVLMRLSSEKFFVLLSLYTAFLLFRVPHPYVAALISLNARVSNAFARCVLYSFPLVCWLYGAGMVFSTLVSVVFWGGPLYQIWHGLRSHACTISVKGLRPATAAEIQRMHNDCAICWAEMTVPGAAGAPAAAGAAGEGSSGAPADGQSADSDGSTLPCSHAYHATCLQQWLQQCHSQGSAPTCPMCQQRMQLAVKWHLRQALFAPAVWQLPTRRQPMHDDDDAVGQGRGAAGDAQQGADAAAAAAAAGAGAGAAPNNYLLRHNARLAELLADMPHFLAPENVQLLADVQELRWQRQQLVNELQRRQQQLQQLEGRHLELELRLELQRQQLINDLHLLAQQLQQQQQHHAGQQQQHPQEPQQGATAAAPAAALPQPASAPSGNSSSGGSGGGGSSGSREAVGATGGPQGAAGSSSSRAAAAAGPAAQSDVCGVRQQPEAGQAQGGIGTNSAGFMPHQEQQGQEQQGQQEQHPRVRLRWRLGLRA